MEIKKFISCCILCIQLLGLTAAPEGGTFEEQWLTMQKKYAELCSNLSAKISDLEEIFCHDIWKDAKRKMGQLILGPPNRRLLFTEPITRTMVRTGNTAFQAYEISFLQNCLTQKTKQLINSYNDVNFGQLQKECNEFHCSTNTLGHLFYAAKVLELVNTSNPKTIVEFGGGYGNLARIFKKILSDSTIIIIDLPEFIALQYLFLTSTLTDQDIFIHSRIPTSYKKGAIHLVPVFLLDEIEIQSDIFISTFGLSESPEIIHHIIGNKNFFGADICYISGQLSGWGQQFKFSTHTIILDSMRKTYPVMQCQPFHHFLVSSLKSYEAIGIKNV